MKEIIDPALDAESCRFAHVKLPIKAHQSGYEYSRTKVPEIFSRRGFVQVSMRELAGYLGVKPGSFYHHFPSKQHILFELMEEVCEDLNSTLDECLGGPCVGMEALQAFVEARIELHEQHTFHSRLAQRDATKLEDEHLLVISQLKADLEHKLQRLLGFSYDSSNLSETVAAHAISELIITLPDWLGDLPNSKSQKLRVAVRLIMGAIQGVQLSNEFK